MFNKKKKKKIFIFFEAALALSICCFAARMIKAHASSTDSADNNLVEVGQSGLGLGVRDTQRVVKSATG